VNANADTCWTEAEWFSPPLAAATRLMMSARDEDRVRLNAISKILVDFCFRNAVVMTLVSRPTQIDHHFFLDFTFY
jgi:hypothetical protein